MLLNASATIYLADSVHDSYSQFTKDIEREVVTKEEGQNNTYLRKENQKINKTTNPLHTHSLSMQQTHTISCQLSFRFHEREEKRGMLYMSNSSIPLSHHKTLCQSHALISSHSISIPLPAPNIIKNESHKQECSLPIHPP